MFALLYRSKYSCVLPAILFLLIQISYDSWTQFLYHQSSLKLDPSWLKPIHLETGLIQYSKEFSALSSWSISFYALFLLQILSIICACAIFVYELNKRGKKAILIGVLLAVLFILIISLFQMLIVSQDTNFRIPITGELVKAIDAQTGLSVGRTIRIATSLVPLSASAFAFALGALVIPVSSGDTAHSLRRKTLNARFLLALFSLMIVAGTIELRILYEWPSVWLQEKDAEQIRLLAFTLSNAAGLKHSITLLLICTPVFLLLNNRAWKVAELATSNEDLVKRQEWMSNSGLSYSLVDVFATVGAIVAPAFSNRILGAVASSIS